MDADTAELFYPKDILKSLCESWAYSAADILPSLLELLTIFNLNVIVD